MIWRTVKPGWRVGDDGAVGADFDRGRLRVDVDGDAVALDVGFDGEVGEDFDGKNPGLEDAVLLAEEDAVFAGDGEGLFGFSVRGEDGAGGFEGDGIEGCEGGNCLGMDRSGDCGRCGKEQGQSECGGPARRSSETVHGVSPGVRLKANSLPRGGRVRPGAEI